MSYVPVDAITGEGFSKLKKVLGNSNAIRAFYLAVAPSLFGEISHSLKETRPDHRRIPASSSKSRSGATSPRRSALNDQIGADFGEHQIFRIDHYLGKETVQNLMALRFANMLFEPLWNSAHIDHVQITVAETVGLEDRVTYYDKAGALRDMVQNHISAAAVPGGDGAAVVDGCQCGARRKAEGAAFAEAHQRRRSAEIDGARPVPGRRVVRRRGEGLSRGTRQPQQHDRDLRRHQGGYRQLALGGRAVLPAHRQAARFARLGDRHRVQGRYPHSIFGENAGRIQPNQLVIRLQPDEGVKQWIMIKDPGPGGMRLRQIALDMTFADTFQERNPDAYERLIMDVIRGNQTLFMRRDEVEAAWRWIDPIFNAWADSRQEVQNYTRAPGVHPLPSR